MVYQVLNTFNGLANALHLPHAVVRHHNVELVLKLEYEVQAVERIQPELFECRIHRYLGRIDLLEIREYAYHPLRDGAFGHCLYLEKVI